MPHHQVGEHGFCYIIIHVCLSANSRHNADDFILHATFLRSIRLWNFRYSYMCTAALLLSRWITDFTSNRAPDMYTLTISHSIPLYLQPNLCQFQVRQRSNDDSVLRKSIWKNRVHLIPVVCLPSIIPGVYVQLWFLLFCVLSILLYQHTKEWSCEMDVSIPRSC